MMRGFTSAGARTGFAGEGLLKGLFFDAGVNTYKQPKYIFLTHCHSDHCAALLDVTSHLDAYCELYLPLESLDAMNAYVASAAKLTGSVSDLVVRPVLGSGQMTSLNESLAITAHTLQHDVPCVSYTVHKRCKVLKTEYRGLEPAEIKKVIKQGGEITYTVFEPVITYFGDTLVSALPEKFEAPVVFLECTFMTEEELGSSKHCCWPQLEPVVRSNPETHFVLIHFSRRYNETKLLETFNRHPLKNVTLWLQSGPNNL
ncbi:MAG: MBL fold metallo-hydrolase [Desulfosporosinus sp.]|nr:MBL fold metallo-hydrolase [Desulfosporosinus sp.]